MNKVRAALAALMVAVTFATTANAMPIVYGDFVGAPGQGSFLNVTEDSPTDMTPLFEPPTLLPDSLFFSPLTFTSFANNGNADTTTGILTMIVSAAPGLTIGELAINLTADTTLLGTGDMSTFSSIATAVEIEDLNPGVGGIQNFNLNYTPTDMFSLPGDGFVEVEGNLVIDLTGFAIQSLALTIEHTLATGSQSGTTSFIQAKSLDIDVTTIPIPEPATAMVLLTGAVMLRRRR